MEVPRSNRLPLLEAASPVWVSLPEPQKEGIQESVGLTSFPPGELSPARFSVSSSLAFTMSRVLWETLRFAGTIDLSLSASYVGPCLPFGGT
jgi:hypothetical protein